MSSEPESLESSSSSGSYETASDLPPVSHRASMSRSGHLSSSTHTRSTVVSSTHASSKASHSEPYSAMEEEDSDDKDISKAEACFRTVVCCGRNPLLTIFLSLAVVLASSVVVIYFVGFGIQTDLGHSFRVIDKPAAERWDAFNYIHDLLANPDPMPHEIEPERSEIHDVVTILYLAHGDNILTQTALDKITQMENELRAVPEYRDHIVLKKNGTEPHPQTLSEGWFPDFANYEEAIDALATRTDMEAVQQRILCLDRGFAVNGTKKSKAMRSQFSFGTPLPGYNNSKSSADQDQKIADFILNSYSAKLKNWFQNPPAEFDVYYISSALADEEVSSFLLGDMIYILLAVVTVWAYMWFHTKSLFLAMMGLLEFLLTFPMAYSIFMGVLRYKHFSVMNTLSIFVLLGIGADDVFIFTDTWAHSAYQGKRINRTPSTKLYYTMKRAAKATFVTTLTTSAAFFANGISTIPAIQEFGVFTGVMLIVNYALVITFFPACIVLRWKYLRPFSFCCLRESLFTCLPWVKTKDQIAERTARKARGEGKLRMLMRFFKNPYTKVVYKIRFILLAFFAALLIAAVALTTQIKADDEVFSALPPGHLFNRFQSTNSDYFVASSDTSGYRFYIQWGISGFDRSLADTSVSGDFGRPTYAPISVPDSEAVAFQNSILETCELYRNQPGEDVANFFVEGRFYCFMEAFRDYTIAQGDTFPVTTNVVDKLCKWKNEYDPNVDRHWKSEVYCNGDEDNASSFSEIKMMNVWGVSTVGEMPAAVARPIHDRLDQMIRDQCALPETPDYLCRAVYQTSRVWIEMETEEELFFGALFGIFFSLGLVLITVFFSTLNFIITLLSFVSIAGTVVSILGFMVVIGWKLGVVESVCSSIVAGLSVDYVVHFAMAYVETKLEAGVGDSSYPDRYHRTRIAVTALGVSVLSAAHCIALTTLLSSVWLNLTTVTFYLIFGQFTMIAITFSSLWAFFCFIPLLFVFGPDPNGKTSVKYYLKGKLFW